MHVTKGKNLVLQIVKLLTNVCVQRGCREVRVSIVLG